MGEPAEWIALTLAPNLGPRRIARVFRETGSIDSFFSAQTESLSQILNIKQDAIKAVLRAIDLQKGRALVKLCRDRGVAVTTLDSPDYPVCWKFTIPACTLLPGPAARHKPCGGGGVPQSNPVRTDSHRAPHPRVVQSRPGHCQRVGGGHRCLRPVGRAQRRRVYRCRVGQWGGYLLPCGQYSIAKRHSGERRLPPQRIPAGLPAPGRPFPAQEQNYLRPLPGGAGCGGRT